MSTVKINDQELRPRDLKNKKIAVLATDGFEQTELTEPHRALREMGAEVHVISPAQTQNEGRIRGWSHTDWGEDVDVDQTLESADAAQYHALLLPGGVMNPDQLRMRDDATRFVREFFKEGKPVAAICHGAQTLIDCGVIEGRSLTSYPSIKNDLKNAGARWEDREVVCDQGLVTSRTPDDLPAFVDKFAEEVVEGAHAKHMTA